MRDAIYKSKVLNYIAAAFEITSFCYLTKTPDLHDKSRDKERSITKQNHTHVHEKMNCPSYTAY